MHPFMPSFPPVPDQIQANAMTNPRPQQVGLPWPHAGNSSTAGGANHAHQFPFSCPHHITPQPHALGNQIQTPATNVFNNQNSNLSNSNGNCVSTENSQVPMPIPCFPNAPPCNHALQNVNMVPPAQKLNQSMPLPVHNQFFNAGQNASSSAPARPPGQLQFHNGLLNANQIAQPLQNYLLQPNLSPNVPMQVSGQLCWQNQLPNFNVAMPTGAFQNPMVQTEATSCNSRPSATCLHPNQVQTQVTPFNSHPSTPCPYPNQIQAQATPFNSHPSATCTYPNQIQTQVTPFNSHPSATCPHPNQIQTQATPFNSHPSATCTYPNQIQTQAPPFNSHPSATHPNHQMQKNPISIPAVSPQSGAGNFNASPNCSSLPVEGMQSGDQGKMRQHVRDTKSFANPLSKCSNRGISGSYRPNSYQGGPEKKSFGRNGDVPIMRHQKPKLNRMENSREHFKVAHERHRKGNHSNVRESHLSGDSKRARGECQRNHHQICTDEEIQHPGSRKLPHIYTEEEIRQWREERRKNFPSNANIERKLHAKLAEGDLIDNDAKIRRQKLREVIAKQAEMGLEIPELPPNYLSESESQKMLEKQDGDKDGKHHRNKRGRQSRFNKRNNRRGPNNRSAKKQRLGGRGDANKREPTLLQKLLSAEINRDKSHLLQVIRFAVLNSFFKSYPEKPLQFPLVAVKDTKSDARDDTSLNSDINYVASHVYCEPSAATRLQNSITVKDMMSNVVRDHSSFDSDLNYVASLVECEPSAVTRLQNSITVKDMKSDARDNTRLDSDINYVASLLESEPSAVTRLQNSNGVMDERYHGEDRDADEDGEMAFDLDSGKNGSIAGAIDESESEEGEITD